MAHDSELSQLGQAIENGEYPPPVQLALTVFWAGVVGLFVAGMVLLAIAAHSFA